MHRQGPSTPSFFFQMTNNFFTDASCKLASCTSAILFSDDVSLHNFFTDVAVVSPLILRLHQRCDTLQKLLEQSNYIMCCETHRTFELHYVTHHAAARTTEYYSSSFQNIPLLGHRLRTSHIHKYVMS